MSSVLRSVRKRKKGRTLGAVDVIDREGYAELEVDAKVELIRSLIPLGLLHIEELLDEEVTALAGERYARKDPSVGGRRHGSNPGTVGLAGQRVPIRVPRIRHVTEREIPLRSYEALHGDRAVNDLLLRRVLYGISCRNYAAAAEAIPGAIGLSGSTVSRAFIQASATKLRELQERDLSGEDVVALVLDGKTFAEATMVVALGITMTGDKRFLGFVETDTENEQVLTPYGATTRPRLVARIAEAGSVAGRGCSPSPQDRPDALPVLVLTVAGWVNRPPEDQLAYLREEQRSLRASWPGGSVGPGARPWLAASARPVAACATIAGRLAPVGLDASRGAQPGGVRRPPPPVRGRKPGVRWSGPLRPVARGGGAARCARRPCGPGGAARHAASPVRAAPDRRPAGRRPRAVPARG